MTSAKPLLAALLTASVALTGCGRRGDPSADGAPVVAVVPKGTTHEFWKSIHAGALKAASETGARVEWRGPTREDDREAQINLMDVLISRRVDGIVIAPLDDRALVAPIERAVEAGIPVVIIDSDLQSDAYVSFVATDNHRGGHLGGQRLAELLGGGGKVVMLRYQEGSASTMNREAGFLEAIAEHPDIEVVSAHQYGGATRESAQDAAENLLAGLLAQGVAIDGVFTPNESTTYGMMRALDDKGLLGTVRFVGFDASPALVEAMREGKIHGLTVQHPFNMGYLGVTTMVAHLRGEPVERRIDTGAVMVTPENMDDPDQRELLNPDLERWLGR